MTRKLYYDDPRTLEFEAAEGVFMETGGRRGVRLEATYFYPTTGGQPHDLGSLGAARVVEVTDDEDGVTHWLEGEPGPAPWKARIDAARRLDHMQQHTGQHVLSQAFLRALRAPTVSFHLGAESATIDIELRDATRIGEAEALANRILAEGRGVRAYEVEPAEVESLGLRKPPAARGRIRIVDIADFDRSACGGTHVSNTSEIQLIKILGTERVRENLRVEFVCGTRALADYTQKHELLQRLGARFTTGPMQVEAVVGKKLDEAAALRKSLERLEQEQAAHEVQALGSAARAAGSARILTRWVEGRSPAYVRALAAGLGALPGMVFALGAAAEPPAWFMGHGPGVELDLRPVWKSWSTEVGARGGGQPQLLQGGGLSGIGPEAALARADALLSAAVEARP
jgi:alanyl-tRNA synthetase